MIANGMVFYKHNHQPTNLSIATLGMFHRVEFIIKHEQHMEMGMDMVFSHVTSFVVFIGAITVVNHCYYYSEKHSCHL